MPLTKLESSDARNNTLLATSSALPTRPIGTDAARSSSRPCCAAASGPARWTSPGVAVGCITTPGATIDRAELEDVLTDGESLSSFVESSVRRAVETRRVLRGFDARCKAALANHVARGESFSSGEVIAELRRRTEDRRTQMLGNAGAS